jgi:hypothetical protein
MWAAAFPFGGNTVNLRTAAPAPRGLLLPPDFNALPLHKPRVMLDAEVRLNDNGEIGFVVPASSFRVLLFRRSVADQMLNGCPADDVLITLVKACG